MACATLKRALDWESLNQRPTKRRRCVPYGQSAGNSPSRGGQPTVDGATNSPSTTGMPSNRFAKDSTEPSPFSESALAKMSPDKMAENLCNEIKRLHKRKQLPITSSALERMQDSESSGSEMGPESPLRPDSPPSHMMRHHNEKALFTFKQVQLICEGIVKDREDQLRERYESVLTTKLAEQYDAFVKFTYDQIQRRYEAAPSYLS
ncbi:akirin [Drosophila sulfurigaster albostrigata]|uniref:Akirin n=1 Tax=Drosophila albomicans TaxID=7291 RepID=A0A6P8XDA3_DROAB|nr:akirin [Drosophila albomicans]XP_060656074.1 akirin [Drosophila nasuta]XP_062135303.1 akirin [Drosophila sulfurigaster albostrigata]